MRASTALALATTAMLSLAACNLSPAADLAVGDCFLGNFGNAVEVTTVRVVDCSESHNAEVYHVFDLGFGGTYEEDAVLFAADQGCFNEFEAYLGIKYEESAVYSRGFYPLLEGWNDGEREVICYMTIPDETLTSSLKGSGR